MRLHTVYNDMVASKVTVSFMEQEGEFILIIRDCYRVSPGDLLPVSDVRVIWESHLTELEKSKKSCEDHGMEDEIIM